MRTHDRQTDGGPQDAGDAKVPRRRHRRLGIALMTAALAVGVLAAPVAAATPYTEQITDLQVDTIDCGSFTVVMTRWFSGHFTVYFDADGNATRVQVTVSVTGTVVNTTTGTTLPLRGGLQQTLDFVAGTASFSGAVFLVTRAGKGSVITDVGRFVVQFVDEDPANDIILLEAGPHDAIDLGDAAFCAALA
jgi:hypothetical protein